MFRWILALIRQLASRRGRRPLVRPWALFSPVLVLLIALPMLRPLRHPAEISDDEALRLATINALVEHGTLELGPPVPAIESSSDKPAPIVHVNGRAYADQPPMLALLLSGPARLLKRFGLTLSENAALVSYVLTLLGATLPAALAAGLLYRMGRLFELPRLWRAGFGAAVVFGSGLACYAVVLNPHAPAAALLLCAAACLIHVNISKMPRRSIAWVTLAGACAALAATLDPPVGLIAAMMLIAVLAIRVPLAYRVLAGLLFVLGAAAPVAVHSAWEQPINGEVVPGWTDAGGSLLLARALSSATPSNTADEPDSDDVISSPSRWIAVGKYVSWSFDALLGSHGIFSHFPVILFGVLGIAAVMHRHWPPFVKALAGITAIGAVAIIALFASVRSDWHDAMFATRWFVPFLPLILFWSGAWLRRKHSQITWTIAASMLAFSMVVAIIGMTEPYPRGGYDRYTPRQALARLIHGPPKQIAIGAAR